VVQLLYTGDDAGESTASSQAGCCQAWTRNWPQLPVLMAQIGRSSTTHLEASVVLRPPWKTDKRSGDSVDELEVTVIVYYSVVIVQW